MTSRGTSYVEVAIATRTYDVLRVEADGTCPQLLNRGCANAFLGALFCDAGVPFYQWPGGLCHRGQAATPSPGREVRSGAGRRAVSPADLCGRRIASGSEGQHPGRSMGPCWSAECLRSSRPADSTRTALAGSH